MMGRVGWTPGHNVVVKLLKRISFGMRNPKAYCKENNAGAFPNEIFTTGFDIEPAFIDFRFILIIMC